MNFATASAGAAKLDPSFGVNGSVLLDNHANLYPVTSLNYQSAEPGALAIDSQGRILVGGGGDAALLLARYLPDGTLDPSFGDGGLARILNPSGSFDSYPETNDHRIVSILIRPDGRIVLVVKSRYTVSEDYGVEPAVSYTVFLDEGGNLDADEFNEDGWASSPLNNDVPTSGALLPNGNVLVGGIHEPSPDKSEVYFTAGYVGERDGSGYTVRTFAEGGPRDPEIHWSNLAFFKPKHGSGTQSEVRRVIHLKSNRILVGGTFNGQPFVGRLKANGLTDPTFGSKATPGRSVHKFPADTTFGYNGLNDASDLTRNSRGQMIQAGAYLDRRGRDSGSGIALLKYLRNGRIDRSFGNDGVRLIPYQQRFKVNSVAVQKNGRIVVAGSFSQTTDQGLGPYGLAVLRFMPDGKPDRGFFDNGIYRARIGRSNTGNKVAIDSDGRIVVAGGASINGEGHFVVKRFLPGH